MLRTKAILKLSRHLRAVLDKLPFPEDVIVTVDVDAYQLMYRSRSQRAEPKARWCWTKK